MQSVEYYTVFNMGYVAAFSSMMGGLMTELGEAQADGMINDLLDKLGDMLDGESTGVATIALSMMLLRVLVKVHEDNPHLQQLLNDVESGKIEFTIPLN